jgi:Fe-S cluster assembly iron-binding protein IscA
VVSVDGVKVALDSMAASRLDGAVIQYDEDEDGYLLDHPDAVTAVWCG